MMCFGRWSRNGCSREGGGGAYQRCAFHGTLSVVRGRAAVRGTGNHEAYGGHNSCLHACAGVCVQTLAHWGGGGAGDACGPFVGGFAPAAAAIAEVGDGRWVCQQRAQRRGALQWAPQVHGSSGKGASWCVSPPPNGLCAPPRGRLPPYLSASRGRWCHHHRCASWACGYVHLGGLLHS